MIYGWGDEMEIKYYKKACQTSCDGINEKIITEIVEKLKIDAKISIFQGLELANKAGIPELPALIIDDQLALSGYKPTYKEIEKQIKKIFKKSLK